MTKQTKEKPESISEDTVRMETLRDCSRPCPGGKTQVKIKDPDSGKVIGCICV